MSAVIKVEGLSKKYSVGEAPAKSLREAFERMRKSPSVSKSEFWALKDISFEVQRGEIIGVIGRNGAGKSTLLKILSKITEPTSGRAVLKGRVASLLEVGTGFHPDLTGRENIYLNGAILGMRKREIDKKLDEIIDFSEIENFLDTPVKRYSSGMYVRLAFAVAAHLDPEILLIDEVLAVGDIFFQRKCLGKMGDVAKGGRTVLFVSHNMVAIRSLCTRAVCFDGGGILQQGEPVPIIENYVSLGSRGGESLRRNKFGTGDVVIGGAVLSGEKNSRQIFNPGEAFDIHFDFTAMKAFNSWYCSVGIRAMDGTVVAATDTRALGIELPPLKEGAWKGSIRVSGMRLVPGRYMVGFGVCNGNREVLEYIEDALCLEIAQVPVYGVEELDQRWGVVLPEWSFYLRSAK